MNQTLPLSVIILTRNAEATLENTITSVKFSLDIIVVDNGSTDNTIQIAKKNKARVLSNLDKSFAIRRNFGLAQAHYDWVLYVDADETVTPELMDHITKVVETNKPQAFFIQRQNHFLGTVMYQDAMERLFHKAVLITWEGDVHEHPILRIEPLTIPGFLIHYTHTDIESMLYKTNQWSETETNLRINAKHPPVVWWRLIRIAATVWWEQLVQKKVWRYGRAGWYEGYFQMIDKLIVYVKLYEKQINSQHQSNQT